MGSIAVTREWVRERTKKLLWGEKLSLTVVKGKIYTEICEAVAANGRVDFEIICRFASRHIQEQYDLRQELLKRGEEAEQRSRRIAESHKKNKKPALDPRIAERVNSFE